MLTLQSINRCALLPILALILSDIALRGDEQVSAEEVARLIEVRSHSDTMPSLVPPWEISHQRERAIKGVAEAQYILAEWYLWGGNVPKNEAEAARWFRKAYEQYRKVAAQGEHGVLKRLASMYSEGIGTPKDGAEAVKYYSRAAEQGDEWEQYSLGDIFDKGEIVPRDVGRAVLWYRKAAERGFYLAQEKLGDLYAKGDGIPKDTAEALKWYRMPAEKGSASAQVVLGLRYFMGDGVPKDATEAIRWFRKAAEQGDSDGQKELGDMYSFGFGVPRDDAEAVKWWSKAAEQGNLLAQQKLGHWTPTKPPQQKSKSPREAAVEAQQRAIATHPSLGVADSPLNQEFVARVKWYQATLPDFFKNPEWATYLAEECEKFLREKERETESGEKKEK